MALPQSFGRSLLYIFDYTACAAFPLSSSLESSLLLYYPPLVLESYVALISLHVSSAVSISLSFACLHLLSGCVLKHSLVASSVSLSMSNLLFSASLGIFLSFILIPAITSLWSDATSGPTNVRHLVTALFHLLFTIMKSIMFFVLSSGESKVHFLFAFLW